MSSKTAKPDRLGLSGSAYAGLTWAAHRFGVIDFGQHLVQSDVRRLRDYEDDRIRREAPGLTDEDMAEIRRLLSGGEACPHCGGTGRVTSDTVV